MPPACVIGEAMMSLILTEAIIEKFGGDHIDELLENFSNYIQSHNEFGNK